MAYLVPGRAPRDEPFEWRPAEIPQRERTWADHDEPYQWAPYHLTDRERLRLWRHKETMVYEEWRCSAQGCPPSAS